MAEPTVSLSDEQAVEYGFAPAPAAPTTTEVTKEETPTTEVTTAPTPPVAEKPAESGVTPKAEVTPTDGGKPLYTPEEIEQILKADGTLDSSRLDAQGKLVQKSFQRGTTQKFEQAKKMMDEANRKLAEFEQKQREIENKKIFDKEAEELGEETALQRKELREIKEEQARLRWERDQAQQRETSLRIREDFRQVVPKFHIPQEQVFEDFILSRIVAGDMIRVGGEEPPRDIEESAAQCADMLGLTNVENLWKIIRANPENELAVKNFYINNYVKEKAKGPTVSPSSTANVQTPKPPADTKDSMDADVRAILGLQPGEQIILT